ncbi:DMT family transporter [Moraxella oblonga]|uniref:DMT family transporter n=1 Tax=Moraxella oblonga TaxID=200413 RepID=UPI00082AC8CD|nr:DMT family transporter [Moraxella oblonga]
MKNPLTHLSPTTQGYVFSIITMCVWGSFSLLARVNVYWGIKAWDIIALRFGISAVILIGILIYQKNCRFLFSRRAFLLAIFGGVGYSSLVYQAFLITPVVHGAVFLNGMIPVATAILMYAWYKKRPDKDTQIALLIIGITLVCMCVLMFTKGVQFGVGDGLFLLCAFTWSIYGLMLKDSGFSAWQAMCATAIWSAVVYLPIYGLFIDSSLANAQPTHIAIQAIFHSIIVMILATVTYALAVERLGAFIAGGLGSLAPFISAIIAVPLLGEPLNHVMVLGLIGMGLGTIQPWRFLKLKKDNL